MGKRERERKRENVVVVAYATKTFPRFTDVVVLIESVKTKEGEREKE